VRLLDSVAAGCTVIALSRGLFLAGVFSRGELQGVPLQEVLALFSSGNTPLSRHND
jgi:hypothetical protein